MGCLLGTVTQVTLPLQPERPERQSTILPLKQACEGSGFASHVKPAPQLTSVASVFFLKIRDSQSLLEPTWNEFRVHMQWVFKNGIWKYSFGVLEKYILPPLHINGFWLIIGFPGSLLSCQNSIDIAPWTLGEIYCGAEKTVKSLHFLKFITFAWRW